MASERIVGSDSDDSDITEVSDEHLQCLKWKLMRYIRDTDNISARIKHTRGQPAQLVFTLGAESGKSPSASKTSNKILVNNLPPSYDEHHLQMYFEYEKGKIGQPVKSIILNREQRAAIVEFERKNAVDVVLSRCPLKIMDNQLEIVSFDDYLDKNERIGSVCLDGNGLHDELRTCLEKLQMCEASSTSSEQIIYKAVEMPGEMKDFVVKCVKESLLKTNDRTTAAATIQRKLMKVYNGTWNCVIGLISSALKAKLKRYISFTLNEMDVIIYQTPA